MGRFHDWKGVQAHRKPYCEGIRIRMDLSGTLSEYYEENISAAVMSLSTLEKRSLED